METTVSGIWIACRTERTTFDLAAVAVAVFSPYWPARPAAVGVVDKPAEPGFRIRKQLVVHSYHPSSRPYSRSWHWRASEAGSSLRLASWHLVGPAAAEPEVAVLPSLADEQPAFEQSGA